MEPMPETTQWIPRVLSEYEIGKAIASIEAVLRADKPIAEVGCRQAEIADLESDLSACVGLVSADCGVRFWTRVSGNRFRYGFYKEPWVLDAIEFLDRTDLDAVTRAWISGLLFGYRPSAIQQFITREATMPEKRRRA